MRPNLEYATAVEQIDSIEAVQRRAARFIKRDFRKTSSVTAMLHSLDLDLLENKCKAHRLSTFYLAVTVITLLHCLYPIIFLPNWQCFTRSFSNVSFIQPTNNHDYYLYSSFQGQ